MAVRPKPKRKSSKWQDLCNRLQAGPATRREALSDLLSRFRASDEYALAFKMMRRTSTTITTHQLNADRPEFVYLINMTYEDREAEPLHGCIYPSQSVIKSWNSMIDGVIFSYLHLCHKFGRYI